jgi:hypothetical protein
MLDENDDLIAELDNFCDAIDAIVWPWSWLVPRKLKHAVMCYRIGGAFQAGLSIYDAFPQHKSMWQRFLGWLFPILGRFETSDFFRHLTQLYDAHLLTRKTDGESEYSHNIDNEIFGYYLKHQERARLVDILLFLAKKTDVLCDEHREKNVVSIVNYSSLEVLYLYLLSLFIRGLLTNDEGIANFELAIQHTSPVDLLAILDKVIQEKDAPVEKYQLAFTSSVKHQNTQALIQVLNKASEGSFKAPRFLSAIVQSNVPKDLLSALSNLEKENLVHHPVIALYLDDVFSHQKPEAMAHALIDLYKKGFLNKLNIGDYIQVVAQSPEPRDMASAIVVLHRAGLIHHAHYSIYFKDILHQPYYQTYRRIMAVGMVMLEKQGLLNQRNINFIAGDCAIGYAELLIELDKVGLLREDNATYYLDLIEKHRCGLHMSRALILRQHYANRFTEEAYETYLGDRILVHMSKPDYHVQFYALRKILSTYKNHASAELFVSDMTQYEDCLFLYKETALLKQLFELDRKGDLSSAEGPHIFEACVKRSLEDASDDSDESSTCDSDSSANNSRFFNKTWAGTGSMVSRREHAEYVYHQSVQMM